MDQNNGGIIGKINTPTTSVASGVWSLDSQFESQSGSTWPLAFPQVTLANSCRFDRGNNDYLNKTFSGAGSRTTWTISVWVKRANEIGTNSYILDSGAGNGTSLYFGPTAIEFWDYQSGSYTGRLTTNALFRDMSAWYHIVAVWDTTNSTAGDRMKLYVNGTEVTSFATDTNPSSSQNSILNDGSTSVTIGRQGSIYSNLYMTEFIFVDGQALTPTSFGVFNTVSNVWEPRPYTGTYGTNGFKLNFTDSSNLGDDTSGNGNDFTVNNLTSVDQSTDTCSNNFATKLGIFQTATTFSQGNLVSTHSSNAWAWSPASMSFTNGKWYAEVKVLTANYTIVGLTDVDDAAGYGVSDSHPGKTAVTPNGRGFAWYYDDGKIYYNNTSMTGPGTYTTNDILMIAIDMTNRKYHFGKNGSWLSSSDPANNTGGYTFQTGGTWTFFDAVGNGGSVSWNYGSPEYSVSSGNADANGFGNFEYSVPSGYFALCTKNLAENG